MMRSKLLLLGALFALATALSGCFQRPANWQGGLIFDRYMVIVLENTDYATALKDPYLKDLTAHGSLLTNFHAFLHPSYPNYMAMVGGKYYHWSIFDHPFTYGGPSIADLLEANGYGWKNYAEGYPGGCFLGATQGRYARRHVPFINFRDVQKDPARCANIVPASQFETDLAAGKVPEYVFYSPNLDDDGHDTDVTTASKWLKGFLDPLLANEEFMKHTLIEITFDESHNYLMNHIYTLLLGGMVKQGYESKAHYTHFDVMRTIEENFGLGTLGRFDDPAKPILDVWSDQAVQELQQRIAAFEQKQQLTN